jgi:hypothetical protein
MTQKAAKTNADISLIDAAVRIMDNDRAALAAAKAAKKAQACKKTQPVATDGYAPSPQSTTLTALSPSSPWLSPPSSPTSVLALSPAPSRAQSEASSATAAEDKVDGVESKLTENFGVKAESVSVTPPEVNKAPVASVGANKVPVKTGSFGRFFGSLKASLGASLSAIAAGVKSFASASATQLQTLFNNFLALFTKA